VFRIGLKEIKNDTNTQVPAIGVLKSMLTGRQKIFARGTSKERPVPQQGAGRGGPGQEAGKKGTRK
jgi:hypothetical protein